MIHGKFWGPGFMREGCYVVEPALGSSFSFVLENGEVIKTGELRSISDSPTELRMIDEWDHDYWVEKVL